MIRSKALILLILALALAACGKPDPQAVCGSEGNQKQFLALIYSGAKDKEQRGDVAASKDMLTGIITQIDALASSGFLKIETVALSHFDPDTGNIDCEAKLSFRLPDTYHSPLIMAMAQELASKMGGALPQGISANTAAPIAVHFRVLHNANTHEPLIEAGDGSDAAILNVQALAGAHYVAGLSQVDATAAPAEISSPASPQPHRFSYIDVEKQSFPRVGQCFATAVHDTGGRLEGDLTSGTSVGFEDGHTMVDYEQHPEVQAWQPGDPVKLCVTDLPKNCPAGDHRGIGYSATNTRTGETWKAGDSEHTCGGA